MQRIINSCATFLLAALFLPALLALVGIGQSADYIKKVEKRAVVQLPPLDWSALVQAGQQSWFAQFDRAWGDRFPFRGAIIDRRRRIDLEWGGRRFFGAVGVGRDGWLFFREDCGARLGGAAGVEDLHERMKSLFVLASQYNIPAYVFVVPPKQTVYPEMLGPWEANAIARFGDSRQRLSDMLASFPASQVIPLAQRYQAAKATNPDAVFDPYGTHHSYTGALVLAQAIIDAIDLTLWDPEHVRIEPKDSPASDLNSLVGIAAPRATHLHGSVARPGVSVAKREGPDPGVNPYLPVRYIMQSTGGLRLIPGRTVIIQDSFIYSYLHRTLAQFFADVTFVHYGAKGMGPAAFERVLKDADRLVFEVAERESVTQFRRLVRLREPSASLEVGSAQISAPANAMPSVGGFVEQIGWNPTAHEISMSGWAKVDTTSVRSRLFIRDPLGRLDGDTIGLLEPRKRPDIAAALVDNPDAVNFGFHVTISVPSESAEFGRLDVLEVFSLDAQGTLRRVPRFDGASFTSWDRRPDAFTLAVRYGLNPSYDRQSARGVLDVIEIRDSGRTIEFRGWVPLDCSRPDTRLTLWLPARAAPASIQSIAWKERPDLRPANAKSSDPSPRSGFIISLRTDTPFVDRLLPGDVSLTTQDEGGAERHVFLNRVRVVDLGGTSAITDLSPTALARSAP